MDLAVVHSVVAAREVSSAVVVQAALGEGAALVVDPGEASSAAAGQVALVAVIEVAGIAAVRIAEVATDWW